MIVLAPSSVQELFDYTIEAFNLAEKYRNPVVVILEMTLSLMRERMKIRDPSEIKIVDRKYPNVPPEKFIPFEGEEDGAVGVARGCEGPLAQRREGGVREQQPWRQVAVEEHLALVDSHGHRAVPAEIVVGGKLADQGLRSRAGVVGQVQLVAYALAHLAGTDGLGRETLHLGVRVTGRSQPRGEPARVHGVGRRDLLHRIAWVSGRGYCT